jgi:hypothetical protein
MGSPTHICPELGHIQEAWHTFPPVPKQMHPDHTEALDVCKCFQRKLQPSPQSRVWSAMPTVVWPCPVAGCMAGAIWVETESDIEQPSTGLLITSSSREDPDTGPEKAQESGQELEAVGLDTGQALGPHVAEAVFSRGWAASTAILA